MKFQSLVILVVALLAAPSNVTAFDEYGPVVVKSLLALKHTSIQPSNTPPPNMLFIPYGQTNKSRVILERDGPYTLLITIQDAEELPPPSQQQQNTTIAFLQDLIPTANASSTLINTYQNQIATPLSQAIKQLMNGNSSADALLWATYTGQGSTSSSLAMLCSVAHALQYPGSNVNVITFNNQSSSSSWQQTGFNGQFSFIFDRLISLYYLWPFQITQNINATSALLNPSLFAENATMDANIQQLAQELQNNINSTSFQQALTIPNLPPPVPPSTKEITSSDITKPPGSEDDRRDACNASYQNQPSEATLTCYNGTPNITDLGPFTPYIPPPPVQQPPEQQQQNQSSTIIPQQPQCPPVICKTRPYLYMSCYSFSNNTSISKGPNNTLHNLPYKILHDDSSGADAIVSWNETTKEAIILWQYTSGRRDWYTDLKAYKTDDFVKQLNSDFVGARGITGLVGDAQVHAGFYSQFQSLAIKGVGIQNLTEALYSINNNQHPVFVTISGFSLGAAVSELTAIWAAIKWPRAYITLTTQGSPMVGNQEYVSLLKSTAGMSWRYVFNLDQVPLLPPLPGYQNSRSGIWITTQDTQPYSVELQTRPDIELSSSTWYDHRCGVFYVPQLNNATRMTVPEWIVQLPT